MKIIKCDREYSTMWSAEVTYLKTHGVDYSFVKVDENGMTIWKFKKTKKLFLLLSEFYTE